MKRLLVAGLVLVVTVLLHVHTSPQPQASQEPWAAPRTAFGQPDLQGVWSQNVATPFERPKELADREFLTDEEVAALQAKGDQLFGADAGDAAFGDSLFLAVLRDAKKFASRDEGPRARRGEGQEETGNYNQFWTAERYFDNRTSLITDPPDGRVPAFTPEAQQRLAAAATAVALHPADGPDDRSLAERCITFGVPRLLAGYNSNYQIFQTPSYVVIATEMIHDARIIPLDGWPHVSDRVRQWNGDSRGRWEGDTLVVETTNFPPNYSFRGSSSDLRLLERFTRVSPTTLRYEFTASDPTTWTKPWAAMIPLNKTDERLYEYACNEGNRGMSGILAGYRAQEEAAKSAGSNRPR